jgi:hypothetical protein
MVIVALDYVPHCYSAQDGAVVHRALEAAFARGDCVTLSLKGVSDVPSSFVNAALVPFVRERGADWVKENLRIVSATGQVAGMIRRCFVEAQRASIPA